MAATVVAVIAVGAVVFAGLHHRPHRQAGAVAGSSPRSASSSSPPLQAPVTPGRAPAGAAVPVHVAVPRLGIASGLQSLRLLGNGQLQAPTKWAEAGWYAGGIRPGDVGPAVIAGHVDSVNGPAVFFRLHETRVGDLIQVTEASKAVLTFVVTEVHSYPKNRFPTEVVYGPTALPELRLVTCTGEFDYAHHNYLNNLVVFAVLRSA